jgi:membrane-bound lytic murein transglycosylase D
MLRPRHGLTGVICALALFSAACAARVPATTATKPSPVPQVVAAPAPAAPAPQPKTDPVLDLIALSNRHFETGQRELQLGHLETAKTEFNRALEVFLESSLGARTEPRIREHFDRLVERISAYEVTALAQGDGFTERRLDPASIDEFLTVSTFENPVATAETKQAVVDDLQETEHDIDIPLNTRVLAFVELFTGRLKGYLEEGLSRGARYLPMVQDVFRAEGLPLDLAYVPLIESAFKPSALSKAKARGIWQFMRGTGLEMGLKHDWYIDERADAEKSTRAAAKYLKSLNKMFDGDWHLALASYNGGPGRVQRAVSRSGRTDFWKLSANSRFLPRETRDYVPLILAAMIIARNPAQYGMNITPWEEQEYEVVQVAKAVDIRRVAEWVDIPVQTIQELNPELRRWTTPVRATDYELKVPMGTADMLRERLSEADPTDLATLNRHSVKKGETLASIAKRLKVSRADLAEANYLTIRSKVRPGQQLIIPRAPTLLLATRTENPAPVVEARSADVVTVSNAQAPQVEQSAQSKLIHRVKRGDTLSSIARLYRTTVSSLRRWNRISGNAIQIGQRLTVFTNQPTATN